jgi:D-alanyl-D-alanine dipeptidase
MNIPSALGNPTLLQKRGLAFSGLLFVLASTIVAAQTLAPSPKPADAPAEWKDFVGEYGPNDDIYFVREEAGKLVVLRKSSGETILTLADRSGGRSASNTPDAKLAARFPRDSSGRIHSFIMGNYAISHRRVGPDQGDVLLIKPVRPIDKLRKEALADSPPKEPGPFRKPELIELTTLDPAIHLDIRYATTNDFLGTPVYTQARAFLQRPAAEALVRALHKLQPLGYGLLIHDAYRPWYVTKIFWDATPLEGKIFVADPKEGSRHNRGCAVDLTFYDLATGKPIEMPGTYDEMSERSFPDYPGGTSLQRWHRDLLRRAMESEGFTVYEHEWWHFDYQDWREYPILNIKFEDLHSGQGLASAQ